MIISVPSSLNLSQRSLFSRLHSTLDNSSQLHFSFNPSANGFGPFFDVLDTLDDRVLEPDSFVDEVVEDAPGDWTPSSLVDAGLIGLPLFDLTVFRR